MIRPVQFAMDVQLTERSEYCICYRVTTRVQVVISLRLKEIIESGKWPELQAGDLAEIRSLRELGFVAEKPLFLLN